MKFLLSWKLNCFACRIKWNVWYLLKASSCSGCTVILRMPLILMFLFRIYYEASIMKFYRISFLIFEKVLGHFERILWRRKMWSMKKLEWNGSKNKFFKAKLMFLSNGVSIYLADTVNTIDGFSKYLVISCFSHANYLILKSSTARYLLTYQDVGLPKKI